MSLVRWVILSYSAGCFPRVLLLRGGLSNQPDPPLLWPISWQSSTRKVGSHGYQAICVHSLPSPEHQPLPVSRCILRAGCVRSQSSATLNCLPYASFPLFPFSTSVVGSAQQLPVDILYMCSSNPESKWKDNVELGLVWLVLSNSTTTLLAGHGIDLVNQQKLHFMATEIYDFVRQGPSPLKPNT